MGEERSGPERSRIKPGEVGDGLGEADVGVEPVADFDGRELPLPSAEDMAEDRLVELPDLPPRAIGMLELDFEAGDDPAGEVEIEPVGLAEVDPFVAPVAVGEPTAGDIRGAELPLEVLLGMSLIAIARPASATRASLCYLRSQPRRVVGEGCP